MNFGKPKPYPLQPLFKRPCFINNSNFVKIFFDILFDSDSNQWSLWASNQSTKKTTKILVVIIQILLGSYYTHWSYYTYCLIFLLIESIISTGWSQWKSIVLFFLLLYYSSYYTYWSENFPPFTNISTGWSKKSGLKHL